MEASHADIQHAANEAESFCGRWYHHQENKSLLVFVGHTGCGKTRLAKSILRFCQTAAMSAFEKKHWPEFPASLYLFWPEVAAQFAQKNFQILPDAFENELLVLDDLGADNDPWSVAKDFMCQILTRRERKFTVVTTNIRPADWAEKFDVRINDRLFRNSVIVDLTNVPSYAMR